MNQELSENEYILEVGRLAVRLGYTTGQVAMFIGDIRECYEGERSVEECLNIVF